MEQILNVCGHDRDNYAKRKNCPLYRWMADEQQFAIQWVLVCMFKNAYKLFISHLIG